jgi:hypothetical protein
MNASRFVYAPFTGCPRARRSLFVRSPAVSSSKLLASKDFARCRLKWRLRHRACRRFRVWNSVDFVKGHQGGGSGQVFIAPSAAQFIRVASKGKRIRFTIPGRAYPCSSAVISNNSHRTASCGECTDTPSNIARRCTVCCLALGSTQE